jgi:hypothetical protein
MALILILKVFASNGIGFGPAISKLARFAAVRCTPRTIVHERRRFGYRQLHLLLADLCGVGERVFDAASNMVRNF